MSEEPQEVPVESIVDDWRVCRLFAGSLHSLDDEMSWAELELEDLP